MSTWLVSIREWDNVGVLRALYILFKMVLHLFIYLDSICVCACVGKWTCTCAMVNVWRTEDNLWDLAPSFYYTGPGDQSQVVRLGGNCLYFEQSCYPIIN